MTELHWPKRSDFRDASGDGETVSYSGPATYDVPEKHVERYRERGWIDPPEGGESPPATAQTETEADAGSASEDDGDAEDFDPEGFVDASWQSVVSAIEDGEADGNLDAVAQAEADRDGEDRQSVLNALEARR